MDIRRRTSAERDLYYSKTIVELKSQLQAEQSKVEKLREGTQKILDSLELGNVLPNMQNLCRELLKEATE